MVELDDSGYKSFYGGLNMGETSGATSELFTFNDGENMNKNKYKSMTAHVYCGRDDCVHHDRGVCQCNMPHITLGINDLGICQDFEVDFIDLLNEFEAIMRNAPAGGVCMDEKIGAAKEKVIEVYNDVKSL